MKNRSFSALFAGLSACVSLTFLTTPVSADTIDDFLVQQVCLDTSGRVTAEDPVTCPGWARKLQPGERLPYHKWDLPEQSVLAQISDSYPVADLFGRTRVVSTFFFTRAGTVPFFAPGNTSDGSSAYDLVITDGAYASIAGTYDQGAGWQPFWRNSQCSLADSWVVAPRNRSVPFGQGETVTTLTAGFPQCPTVDRFSRSLTRWNYYPNYTYQSGKSLNTIKSWHFSQGSTNSDAIEVFMFTKEYGKTKWEAWQRASSTVTGPDPISVQRCGVGTDNGVARYGTTTYYLAACHDWTFIFPADNGGWDPANFHIDPLYTSQNLLRNTHMQCTDSSGRARPCGQSGSLCRTIAPWNRLGDLNWAFNQNPQSPRESANCSLLFSIPSAFSGQSVYQDTTPSSHLHYSFGAALRAPLTTGQTYPLTLVVHEISSAGTVLATHPVSVNAEKSYRFFKGSFTKHPYAASFRFEVYVQGTNVEYEITDAWIAPQV
jgi:hypothetical protein